MFKAISRWFSIFSLSAPRGWQGASSELAQAGFHARYQAAFHAGFNAPRSA